MQTHLQPLILSAEETAFTCMKSLIKESLHRDGLTLKKDRAVPHLGPGEARVRVLKAAVCGTDKSIYLSQHNQGITREMQRYLQSPDDFRPIVIGHEFAGVVEELGPGVDATCRQVPSDFKPEPGDYVTAEMHIACGHCHLCRTGNEHICVNVMVKGVHLDGCFAQQVVVPYKNLVLLGKSGDTSLIAPRVASMLDAFGNAVHTVDEADLRGKSVAILGAGPLGLMAVFLARASGAQRVYLTEAADIERRFTLGTIFGADTCIDVSKGSGELYAAVAKHETASNGVDVVLEMSGSPSAYEDAFKIVRNGGQVILLGIAREPLARFDIASGVIWKGVTVKGIFGRKMFSTWETMLRLIRSEHLDIQGNLEKIISRRDYRLEEFQEAFTALTTGKELKLVFTPA